MTTDTTERGLERLICAMLAGRSGRGWTVDFHVRTERRSSLSAAA